MEYGTSPNYLKSADLHNIAGGGESFFSDPVGQTADFIGKIPSFALTSVASGINSIYNSGVVVGNFFGITDAQENDLQQTLNSYDSDLGQYYQEHKGLADTAGFLATSFVPGVTGVKLANAGQRLLSGALKSGKIGTTLAESTGLIPTVIADGKTLTQLAGEALAQGNQTFTVMNAAVLKALGGGVAQATLDSFAFESMVTATMFRSPILEGQDIKDLASNLVVGTLLGGAIGGVINSAGVYGGIKKVLAKADAETAYIRELPSRALLEKNPQARLMIIAQDIKNTPTADQLTNPDHLTLRIKRLQSLELEQQTTLNELVGGDPELAHQMYVAFKNNPEAVLNSFQGAKTVMRPGILGEIGEDYTPLYVKLHGEGLGSAVDELPKVVNIATKLGSKADVERFVSAENTKWSVKGPWKIQTAASMDEIEARYIWAETKAKYIEGMHIDADDIPLLEGALKRKISVVVDDADGSFPYVAQDLGKLVEETKLRVANELASMKKKYGWGLPYKGISRSGREEESINSIRADEIAKAVNVSPRRLESDTTSSMFARQDAQAAYEKLRADKGIKTGEENLSFIPDHAAVVYETAKMKRVTGDTLSGAVLAAQEQKMALDGIDRVAAKLFGEDASLLVHPTKENITGANRLGTGSSLFGFSNSNYQTLGSWAEHTGKVVSDLKDKFTKGTNAAFESPALRLRLNQPAAIELNKINNQIASTTESYILNEEGTGLIASKVARFREEGEGAVVPVLQKGAPEEIIFEHPETLEFAKAHIAVNGKNMSHTNELRKAQSLPSERQTDIFYPIKPDPKEYPYFHIVVDPTIIGAGHKSMIHATSEVELQKMVQMVQEKTHLQVLSKAETEAHFKAEGTFDFDRTLHDNYIDSTLKSAGVNNQYLPKTNPDVIVDEFLRWHGKQDYSLVREAVSAKFANEFDQLRTMGEQFTNIASSRYATSAASVEATMRNPYNDYIKTALNVSRMSEYPLLSSFNKGLERTVSTGVDRILNVFREAKEVNDLQKVNAMLEQAGISHAYKSAAEVLLANHAAPPTYVSNFIRGANAILSATFLRLDFLNPINNALGAQVLLGHETSGQIKTLYRDKLGITVPGTSDKVIGTGKLIAQANKEFVQGHAGMDEMIKKYNWDMSLRDQLRSSLDDLTLSGAETPAQLNTLLGSAKAKAEAFVAVGEKVTGNKFAEQYNRFVAASVGRQLSEARIAAGLMDLEEMPAFINTFINRTQGNMLASQRPLIFQGPVGQAIGLFQSYQFNVMQQLFRGIAEGGPKDAAMLLGLQSTIFGLNGLPGFSYINQHIIGTASGNKNHVDAYSTVYGAAGKTAGEWLMYGIPSNMLQTNLYSRGDINPRTLTVVPVNPADIVAVNAFAKFAGNIKETVGKMAGGGDVWQSFLQGVEHNGISRPLAGLAQALQATGPGGKVYSTTNAGDVSFVNDFISLATASRIAGGKPLDEALANDELQRKMVYQAADRSRMKVATETFKTTLIGDTSGIVTPKATHSYMREFTRNGGRAEEFNKSLLHIMTQVNTPRANQVIETLKGPYAERMKLLLGGRVEDFNPTPTQE